MKVNPVVSDKNALVRLGAMKAYYKNRVNFDFSDSEYLNFIRNNQVTELDRIRLNKHKGNVKLSDLWVSRNSTLIKRRRNAQ